MIQSIAYGYRHSPAWPQNAHHFPKRSASVLEEHEAELADHHIKTLVMKSARKQSGWEESCGPILTATRPK
jgi:hypothetical protein